MIVFRRRKKKVEEEVHNESREEQNKEEISKIFENVVKFLSEQQQISRTIMNQLLTMKVELALGYQIGVLHTIEAIENIMSGKNYITQEEFMEKISEMKRRGEENDVGVG